MFFFSIDAVLFIHVSLVYVVIKVVGLIYFGESVSTLSFKLIVPSIVLSGFFFSGLFQI